MASYLDHWRVSDTVFAKRQDAEPFFTEERRRDLARLKHFVAIGRSASVVEGKVGVGKSRLLCHLQGTLPFPRHEVLLLSALGSDSVNGWLARHIVRHLTGRSLEATSTTPLDELRHAVELFDEFRHGEGSLVVLIDDGDLLGEDALVEVGRCLDVAALTDCHLAFVVAGPVGLAAHLASTPAIRSHLSAVVQLSDLKDEESLSFLAWHLHRAGLSMQLFTRDAMQLLFERSGGNPAKLSTMAENALLEGALQEAKLIDAAVVERALTHLVRSFAKSPTNLTADADLTPESDHGSASTTAKQSRTKSPPPIDTLNDSSPALDFDAELGAGKIPLTALLKGKSEPS